MQKVTITGTRQCEIVDAPDPHAKDNFVVVKVHSAPMCTEYKAYRDGKQPGLLGHEAAGEVVEVAQPARVKQGDRVVAMPLAGCGKCSLCLSGEYIHCQHAPDPLTATENSSGLDTYAQYIIKQDWLLLPIPDGISYDHGSMACCGLGPTMGAMELMRVDSFDTVVITGMGPVGLGGVINAVHRGATTIAVEPHPYRQKLAKKLGATEVLDPNDSKSAERILELTDGRGADKAVDCTGMPQAHRLLMKGVRRKGHIAFVGEGGELSIWISDDMIRNGFTLHGSWHYPLHVYPKIAEVIIKNTEKLDILITHTYPLTRAGEAWERQLTGESGKIVLHPWE